MAALRVLTLGLSLMLAAPALGDNIPCGLVEAGSIHIDGLISDWDGVEAVEFPGTPEKGAPPSAGRPLKLLVRCNYDQQALYLLIEVEDDIIARTPAASPGEDHLELGFASPGPGNTDTVERLLLWPSLSTHKLPRQARWVPQRPLRLIEGEGPAGRSKPRRGPPMIEVYDTLTRTGYAVELRLPNSLLPGYRAGSPLPLGIRAVDGDSRANPQAVAVAQTSPLSRAGELSRIEFQEGESALDGLLESLKLGKGSIWWEQSGNVGSGPARLLMIDRNLGVVADKQYGYQEVAQHRGDIQEVRLIEPGDGLAAVAVRTVEKGNGGSREVLRVYRLKGGQFQAVFAAEVGKQQDKNQLKVQVSYVKRGKATDIVLSPQPAAGYTADTYHELPAEDVQPILLPWQDKKVRYVWKSGKAGKGEKDGAYVKAD